MSKVIDKYFPSLKRLYLRLKVINFNRIQLKSLFKVTFVIIILVASSIIIKNQIEYTFGLGFWSEDSLYGDTGENYYGDDYSEDGMVYECSDGTNVMGINAHGEIWTYIPRTYYDENGEPIEDLVASENITALIEQAEDDENIKAILLEVDSYGGESTAGKEIADALKMAKKPTVVFIREAGLSAAYWAATGADTIFASRTSNIGSIGVTMSYLDNSKKNEKEGIIYQEITSAKYKDTGVPDRPLSEEERLILQRDVNLLHNIFVEEVAANRNMPKEKVAKLADGNSMLGEAALENGLIDRLGNYFDVKDFLAEKIGEEVVDCWY